MWAENHWLALNIHIQKSKREELGLHSLPAFCGAWSLQRSCLWTSAVAYLAKPLPGATPSHMEADSCFVCSTSDPALCKWPARSRGMWYKSLNSCYPVGTPGDALLFSQLLSFSQLSPGCCHVWSESVSGSPFSLSLLSMWHCLSNK